MSKTPARGPSAACTTSRLPKWDPFPVKKYRQNIEARRRKEVSKRKGTRITVILLLTQYPQNTKSVTIII